MNNANHFPLFASGIISAIKYTHDLIFFMQKAQLSPTAHYMVQPLEMIIIEYWIN